MRNQIMTRRSDTEKPEVNIYNIYDLTLKKQAQLVTTHVCCFVRLGGAENPYNKHITSSADFGSSH